MWQGAAGKGDLQGAIATERKGKKEGRSDHKPREGSIGRDQRAQGGAGPLPLKLTPRVTIIALTLCTFTFASKGSRSTLQRLKLR